MLIIVTGAIGSGKSTVCKKLLEILQNQNCSCGGVLTFKDAEQNIIIENVKNREKMMLASTSNVFAGPNTQKYFFNPQGIAFGIKAISENGAEIQFIDEIGKLELRGEGFAGALQLIQSGSFKNCVLVIRAELLAVFLPHLPNTPLIFEINADNRNRMPEEIASTLRKVLKKAR